MLQSDQSHIGQLNGIIEDLQQKLLDQDYDLQSLRTRLDQQNAEKTEVDISVVWSNILAIPTQPEVDVLAVQPIQ